MTGSGTEHRSTAITRDDLAKFHSTWFKPNNATLVVVGDTTLAEIQPEARGAIRALAARRRAEEGAAERHVAGEAAGVPDRPARRAAVHDHRGAPRPAKTPDGEIAIDAMNDILGGAFTSRINMNLREDKTWAYGADTEIVDTQAQRPFLALAPVQADKTAEAMVEIKRELDDFVGARPPTAQEVATSKNGSTLTLPGRWETSRSVARDIAALVRFHLPDDYWSRYAELVARLTVGEVDAAAKRLLAPNQLTWVVVGDRGVVESKVRALGFGDIAVIDANGKPVESP